MTLEQYLALITSEYKSQPNFMAMVSFLASLPVQVQETLAQMISLFDLDTPPVGDQLDIIGEWVGVSRNVTIPISGIYFSWDDTAYDGWDTGTWQPGNIPTTITALPDDAYLNLIRARIAANQWDGTTESAYTIWSKVFPQFNILIDDHFNMSYDLAIVGGIVDSLTVALITGGYIPLRPEGVKVSSYFVSVDTNKAFAWDVSSTYLAGWDSGSWLRAVT